MKVIGSLVACLFVLLAVAAVGPTLVAVMQAALPLVIAFGVVVVVLRLVWRFTDLYR